MGREKHSKLAAFCQALFHILTPYPGTALYERLAAQGRITTDNWELYDTRQAVFRPAKMTAEVLEAGYWRAYRDFYRWGSIFRAAWTKEDWAERLRHVAYAGGWKRFEPLWDWVIRAKRVPTMLPVLSPVLIAALICVTAVLAVARIERGERLGIRRARVGTVALGGLVALYVFISDSLRALLQGRPDWGALRPWPFKWPLFLVTVMLMALPSLTATWPGRNPRAEARSAREDQR